MTPARIYDEAAQRLDELGREASGRLPWTFQPADDGSRFGALVDADGDVLIERVWEPDAALLAALRNVVPVLVDEFHLRSQRAAVCDDDCCVDARWLGLARALIAGGKA